MMGAGSSSACATAYPPSTDVDVVRDFIAAQLPLSGHLGSLLEAWDWNPDVIADRCTQVHIDGELVGLYLRGRVLRVLGSIIGPDLTDHITPDTRAVMGPSGAITELATCLGSQSPRIIDVWETSVTPSPVGDLRVPAPAEISSFAHASFAAFAEELGSLPTTSPDDASYLDLWSRLAQHGRIVGVWQGARCAFRAEIRPVLGRTVELRGVWLDPNERGRGRAQGYLQQVFAYVARNFTPHVHVLVSRDNIHAVRLYEQMGMTPAGHLGRIDISDRVHRGDAR